MQLTDPLMSVRMHGRDGPLQTAGYLIRQNSMLPRGQDRTFRGDKAKYKRSSIPYDYSDLAHSQCRIGGLRLPSPASEQKALQQARMRIFAALPGYRHCRAKEGCRAGRPTRRGQYRQISTFLLWRRSRSLLETSARRNRQRGLGPLGCTLSPAVFSSDQCDCQRRLPLPLTGKTAGDRIPESLPMIVNAGVQSSHQLQPECPRHWKQNLL